MKSVICTIAQNDYNLGAAALINSLCASGFEGQLHYGYKGNVTWAKQHDLTKPLKIGKIEIIFKKMPDQTNAFLYKPTLILETLEQINSDTQLFFFDCDIIIKCPWGEIENWGLGGIALCQDMHMGYMPASHIRRKAWRRWVAKLNINLSPNHIRNEYFNAGFIGVNKCNKKLIQLWKSIAEELYKQTDNYNSHLPEIKDKTNSHHTNPFYFYDQDALNLALMCVDDEINFFDHRGMDVDYWGPFMSHALGPHKPWRGNFIKRVFQNNPPLYPDIAFSMYLDGPIEVFPKFQKFLWKADLKLACTLAKILGRSKI